MGAEIQGLMGQFGLVRCQSSDTGKRVLTKDIAMEFRADFARREVVRPDGEAWWLSPMAATERCLLDRAGEEAARST